MRRSKSLMRWGPSEAQRTQKQNIQMFVQDGSFHEKVRTGRDRRIELQEYCWGDGVVGHMES